MPYIYLGSCVNKVILSNITSERSIKYFTMILENVKNNHRIKLRFQGELKCCSYLKIFRGTGSPLYKESEETIRLVAE